MPSGTVVLADEADLFFIDKAVRIKFVSSITTKTKAKTPESKEIVVGLTATASSHMTELENSWLRDIVKYKMLDSGI